MNAIAALIIALPLMWVGYYISEGLDKIADAINRFAKAVENMDAEDEG